MDIWNKKTKTDNRSYYVRNRIRAMSLCVRPICPRGVKLKEKDSLNYARLPANDLI
jgi:hypothetical protein